MVEKMAAVEEAKGAAPPDALPLSPCLDILHTPSQSWFSPLRASFCCGGCFLVPNCSRQSWFSPLFE
jgi:hypothetical protein